MSTASDIFLFTLLLLYPFWSILKSFGDTDGCPDWSVCLSMCNLLSLPECFIILSFSLLAVSPKYVSEHVLLGHLTKYVRSCLCTSFVWSFMSNAEPSVLLIYTCCAVWFCGKRSGNTTQKENRSYNYGRWITKQAYWKTKIKEEIFGSNRQVEKKGDSYYI